jgi:S-adenosylmethionine:tRNA ribosyltransferase-isomerase
MPAKLFGQKITGAKLEFLVETVLNNHLFTGYIRTNGTLKIGSKIIIENSSARVLDGKEGLYTIKLDKETIWQLMMDHGHVPLPPYVKRLSETSDIDRYQTVYSKLLGSVAAPTAGLHFTHRLLEEIEAKGAKIAYITLHIGSGTFKPVQVEDITAHQIHSEYVSVSQKTCNLIQQTKKQNGRVIAIGTTTVRALESAVHPDRIKPFFGQTNIFLHPGKQFNIVDAMITNFHLPKSTLMMLVSAFSSVKLIKKSYSHAISNGYRFYSYGDAMFIYQ